MSSFIKETEKDNRRDKDGDSDSIDLTFNKKGDSSPPERYDANDPAAAAAAAAAREDLSFVPKRSHQDENDIKSGLSESQVNVFNRFFEMGSEFMLLCQACAGAGKTKLITHIAQELYTNHSDKCTLVTSFAKATIANFKESMESEQVVTVGTMPFILDDDTGAASLKKPGVFATHLHAIGSALVPRGTDKNAPLVFAEKIVKCDYYRRKTIWKTAFKKICAKALDFCLQNVGSNFCDKVEVDRAIAMFFEVSHAYTHDYIDEIKSSVEKYLEQYAADISFSGLLITPVVQGKKLCVDFVIIDEAQDLSRLEMQLLGCVVGPNTKVLVVGDQYQMLYAFRGVELESLEKISGILNKTVEKATLPFCFRCPKTHIELAQKYASEDVIKPGPGAIMGVVEHITDLKDRLQLGDLVLVPTNVDAINKAFEALDEQLASKVSFRVFPSIKNKILTLCEKENIEEMKASLDAEYSSAEDQDKNGIQAFIRGFLSLMKKMKLFSSVDIKNFTLNSLYAVDNGTNSEVPNNAIEDTRKRVWFSTVHGAKGFGSERVFWFSEEPTTKILRNQCYVAVTRSKSKLFIIKNRNK